MSPRSLQGPRQRASTPSRSWIYEQSGGASGGGGGTRGHAGANAPAVTDFLIQKSVPIGDGADHPLSDVYATLADAQKDYPFAQDLTDTLAWCAIQSAIYRSPYVFLPAGSYVVNRPIDCTNKEFGGIHFYGAGQQSQSPATWTDLAIDATDGKKITSAASPFGARHRWTVLQVTGGTGFTAGQVMISDVTGGVATCTTAVGTPGSTGGTAKSITGCGSRIIAHTNGVVFDCSGSGLLTFEDFYIDGASGTNNSTIGFLFARTYEQPAPESSLMNLTRILVVLRNFAHDGLGVNVNQCLNAGQYLGSVGIVNWCSENFTIHHCYFQADRSYIGQNQLPMNIVDDYPITVDGDGISHGQPLRFFLPQSPYATLFGSDVATPIHIANVVASGPTITYTTVEDLHDPGLFRDLGGGSIGWYNNGGVTVRGVTGFGKPYPVNCTYRQLTLIDSHTFSIELFPYDPPVTGAYGGGGTAFLNTSFSEGVVAIVSSAFIAMGGPCLTVGGVTMCAAFNIYTLSYHPTVNPNTFAAYQIAGQCQGLHLTGASEMTSRILYSRYSVYDLRIDIDNPQDPDAPMARIWLDGENPDAEGGVLVPGIVAGHVRINPLYGKPVHHLIQGGPITGVVACKAVLAPNQDIGLDGGLTNLQVENAEVWNPRLPEIGIYDFATQWGRREIAGTLTLGGPIYSKDTSFRVNGIVGADTDVLVSQVENSDPIVIHTFTDHGLAEGQLVTLYGTIGATPSPLVTNLPCHILTSKSISIPGVSTANPSDPYLGGGFLRAIGKPAYLALNDASTAMWFLMKAASGGFDVLDLRVNRSVLICDRDFATLGGSTISYTDLVIGSDPTTCTSAAKPFSSPLNVGQTLRITGGTGWTVQTATIVSVDGTGLAKCDVSLGTPGATGGHAANPFVLQLLGDYIRMEKLAAAADTTNQLLIDQNGILISSPASSGGGGGSDPTTTKGDIPVRSATALDRLGVGADGLALVADSTQTLGVAWANPQTPWKADVDGGGHNLTDVNQVLAALFLAMGATDIGAFGPTAFTFYNGAFSPRWQISKVGSESGGNAGSDLQIANYSDSGASLTVPIAIRRATGNVGIGQPNPSYQLHVGSDSAGKASTNTWFVFSDLRMKQNSRPYTHGLDAVKALPPVMQAEYNGEGGVPAGLPVIGFNAQDLEPVEPTWVTKTPGTIGGVETDVLSVNTGPLVYMLLNAVRELETRLAAVEAQLQALTSGSK